MLAERFHCACTVFLTFYTPTRITGHFMVWASSVHLSGIQRLLKTSTFDITSDSLRSWISVKLYTMFLRDSQHVCSFSGHQVKVQGHVEKKYIPKTFTSYSHSFLQPTWIVSMAGKKPRFVGIPNYN